MQIFLIIFPVTKEKTKKFSLKISKKLYDVYYKTSFFSFTNEKYQEVQIEKTKKFNFKKYNRSMYMKKN